MVAVVGLWIRQGVVDSVAARRVGRAGIPSTDAVVGDDEVVNPRQDLVDGRFPGKVVAAEAWAYFSLESLVVVVGG